MKRESREMAVTYTPNVNMSAVSHQLEEEDVYMNAEVCTTFSETAVSDRNNPSIVQDVSLVAVCWLILIIIMSLRIHFTSVISAKLSEEMEGSGDTNKNLNDAIRANKNLKRTISDLKDEMENLTRANSDLTNVTATLKESNERIAAENRNVTAEKERVQEENRKISEENQLMRTNLTERGYWTSSLLPVPSDPPTISSHDYITSRQRRRYKRQSEPCETGWLHFPSRCYLIRDAVDRRTWEGAQDDCRVKDGHLVVIETPEEEDFIYSSGAAGSGAGVYWIGLRAEGDRWKWVDGRDLNDTNRMEPPADDRRCAVAVAETKGWRNVSCDVTNKWICQRNPVSG